MSTKAPMQVVPSHRDPYGVATWAEARNST